MRDRDWPTATDNEESRLWFMPLTSCEVNITGKHNENRTTKLQHRRAVAAQVESITQRTLGRRILSNNNEVTMAKDSQTPPSTQRTQFESSSWALFYFTWRKRLDRRSSRPNHDRRDFFKSSTLNARCHQDTFKMLPLIYIITLFMNTQMSLITARASSISHQQQSYLNTTSIDNNQQQAPEQQHQHQPHHNHQQQSQTENDTEEDSDSLEERDVIHYSELITESLEPRFELRCPIEELVKVHPHYVNLLDRSFIEEKLEEIKKQIRVTWFKDQEAHWRINGNYLADLDKFTRVLYQVVPSDAGLYACMLNYTNVNSDTLQYFITKKGASFEVQVLENSYVPDSKPTITHPPSNFFVTSGSNVTFTCNRTENLSHQTTMWFKSCPFRDKKCIQEFLRSFNATVSKNRKELLGKYFYEDNIDADELTVTNVTEDRTGYYGCLVYNIHGFDIRLGQIELKEEWARTQSVLGLPEPSKSDLVNFKWKLLGLGMILFLLIAISLSGCFYIFTIFFERDKKKQEAPLLTNNNNTTCGNKDNNLRQHLPTIDCPDIYNIGKPVDGYISGQHHQKTGHLMSQSICSNILDKKNPSISSSNSQQSDEASSSWGKSMSSNGDSSRAFYLHTSNATATTVPMYDHPPSTGTFKLPDKMVLDRCVINPTYGFVRPETDATEWAFPRRNLERLDKIGEGQFGEVWRYIARRKDGNGSVVAVKQLKSRAGLGDRERLELIAEIEIMKLVNKHPNVVKMLNYCIDEFEPTLLIMEYAENGKLQTYLRDCRATRKPSGNKNDYSIPSITSKELIKFTYHIAKGMEYVSSQGIVHRDLASRNILVSKEKVCKVADFGFARRVSDDCAYERTTANPVPVKWMAPEALVENKFTSKSDVFSFGILIWEIVTLGATPYEQLTSEGVYRKVSAGGRLDRPAHCKDEFYNLMAQCWHQDPAQRPSFKEVALQLEKLLLSESDYIELDQYPEHAYYNILNTAEKEVIIAT